MLEINTARQVENSFDGLICRLNSPEERISGDTSIEISKTGKQRKHTELKKKRTQYLRTGTTTQGVTCIMLTPEGEERQKGTEEILKKKITEIFFKLIAITKELIQRVQRTPGIINTGEKELYVGIHFQIT